MAVASIPIPRDDAQERAYQRRIQAWTLYDWANSGFATTVLAAVLPIYYSQVAGATLPSEATATAYWSLGLSISLLISAVLSPILGTISDVIRGKKRFLAIATGIGVLFTGALVFVGTGDWLLASAVFVLARIGFVAAYTFYDSLLPHVARPEDRDRVSARGYAMGYLGGGLLLVINMIMVFALPGTWGPRLSFVTVALWWAAFSIPLFLRVPEPPAESGLRPGESVVGVAFGRLGETFRDIRRYRELFKFLVAFLIYNDAIGTIISVATIYGAELGFGTIELILALVLVQFVAMPFSLIFGRLPDAANTRRGLYMAFIAFNMVALPIAGIGGRLALPVTQSGAPRPAYTSAEGVVGQGLYSPADAVVQTGTWQPQALAAETTGLGEDSVLFTSATAGDTLALRFNGQEATLRYAAKPDGGIAEVLLDGGTVLVDGEPLRIDMYSPTVRYGLNMPVRAAQEGVHTLQIVVTGEQNPASTGTGVNIERITIEEPARLNSLPLILGLIVAVQALGLLFAFTIGRRLFAPLAARLTTRSSILLALVVYTVIATWGFFLNSTVEFWALAWMVAMVQGGSQALSRSLYASMAPASKSGEFFGFFGIMEKFSSILGPLLFALAAGVLGSSRPAILSLIAFFIIGGWLLTRVNIAEGQRIAREEDAALQPG
jgi:UMF1 family MFS transporter